MVSFSLRKIQTLDQNKSEKIDCLKIIFGTFRLHHIIKEHYKFVITK